MLGDGPPKKLSSNSRQMIAPKTKTLIGGTSRLWVRWAKIIQACLGRTSYPCLEILQVST